MDMKAHIDLDLPVAKGAELGLGAASSCVLATVGYVVSVQVVQRAVVLLSLVTTGVYVLTVGKILEAYAHPPTPSAVWALGREDK